MICKIENCGLPVRNKGMQLCNRHYLKWRRFGDPLRRFVPQRESPCILEDCNSPAYSRKLCAKHYDKLQVYGDPTVVKVPHELHGLHKHPLYSTWQNMKQRCTNPNLYEFKYYGARGITICESWRYSFSRFVNDVGEKPGPEYSLDRIDNNGNYEPGNVRWATMSEQLLNTGLRRDNKSGHKGVSYDKARGLWRAYTGGGKTRVELGYYKDKDEAAKVVAESRSRPLLSVGRHI